MVKTSKEISEQRQHVARR